MACAGMILPLAIFLVLANCACARDQHSKQLVDKKGRSNNVKHSSSSTPYIMNVNFTLPSMSFTPVPAADAVVSTNTLLV